jgi:hypothetical protein
MYGYESLMGKLGDRLGRLDDQLVIYRADDPHQKVHGLRLAATYVVGTGLVLLLVAAGSRLFGEAAAATVGFVLVVVLLVAYVTWRRHRNKELTGSSTRWPTTDAD